jgi:hypothetical protein
LIAPPEISMMKHPGAGKIGSDGWDVALQRNSFRAYRELRGIASDRGNQMAYFVGPDDLYATLGKAFESIVKGTEFAAAGEKSGLVLRLNYVDPEATVLVNFAEGAVSYGADASSSTSGNVDLFMAADDAHIFWLGRMNFAVALARKKIRLEGSTAKAMEMLPLTGPLFAGYRAFLADAGRDDLLNVD